MSDPARPHRGTVLLLALVLLVPAFPLALMWYPVPLGLGFAPLTPVAQGVFLFSWMVALPAFALGQITSLILLFTRLRSLAPLLSLIFSGLFLASVAIFLILARQATLPLIPTGAAPG